MKVGAAPLRGSQVAIACGSHRGTFEQMRAVQDVLTQGSTETNPLTPANLALKPMLPADKQARQAMTQANLAATALAHPCSGSTQHSCGRAPPSLSAATSKRARRIGPCTTTSTPHTRCSRSSPKKLRRSPASR